MNVESSFGQYSAQAVAGRDWRNHLTALGILAAAIMLLFARDAKDMAVIWWTSSTFEHCLFVPLLVGWLIYLRKDALAMMRPRTWLPGLVWLLVGNGVWLLGDAAGVALLRHLGLVVMLQGAVVAILGPSIARALAFPLFYALFMVPFGAEIVPPLQLVTAKLAMAMLIFAGVPAHIEGIFITVPGGYFEVAEACSGAKFVIAMAAYGILVCHVCFRSWTRRALFLTGALGLSVLANGVRAFATIYVAQKTSVDAAVGFDHVIYGWLFFGMVMVLVMAAAWPFFDRSPLESPVPVHMEVGGRNNASLSQRFLALATLCVLIAPFWSMVSARRTPELRPLALPHIAGWARTNVPMAYPWQPRFAGADFVMQGRFRNAQGQVVDVAIATYARQDEGRELVGFGRGAVDPASEWVWSSAANAPAPARGEQITAPGPIVRHVVSFYRVGGITTGSASQVKLATMKARLTMGDQRAAALLISAEDREGHSADAAIAAYVRALGPVDKVADAALAIR